MKVTIEMENLQSIIEESAKINTERAIEDAIREVAHTKVDAVLKGKIEEIVNSSIVGYVNDYLKNAKVHVGNSFNGEGVKEYSVEEYIRKIVSDTFSSQRLTVKRTDRYSGRYYDSEVSFQEYIDEAFSPESIVKPYIDKMARQVKEDVNRKVKSVFDEAMRNTLAENVFAIVSASDTYRTISNNLNLLGE